MANIAIANMTIRRSQEGEFMDLVATTPSTADAGDTVDLSTLLQGRTVRNFVVWDRTTGDIPGYNGGTASSLAIATSIVSLEGATGATNGTTDHTYDINLRIS